MIKGSVSTYLCSIFLAIFIISNVIAQKNSPCLTPSEEQGKCIPITRCEPILSAIQTRNRTAIRYARESHCGYENKVPLVCCGTRVDLRPEPYDELFSIFEGAIRKKTPEEEKQDLEALIHRAINYKDLPNREVCGLEQRTVRKHDEQTDLDEFPWVVLLEYKEKGGASVGIGCGGTLINNRYVLTAAHCLSIGEFEILTVRLGEWNINSDRDCPNGDECSDVKKVKVRKEIPHPFYNPTTGNNDIGLIRLEEDIAYTNHTRAICLPQQSSPAPSRNETMSVAGWGIGNGNLASNIKLKINTSLTDLSECKAKSQPTYNQLCVGDDLAKRTCVGDSGGPLMRAYDELRQKQKQWYLEGILTSGIRCNGRGHPTVYTRVSRFMNWIKRVIAEE